MGRIGRRGARDRRLLPGRARLPDDSRAADLFAGELVSWFNESFDGELARLAPAPGYVAPPLDGIWATAPYRGHTFGDTLSDSDRAAVIEYLKTL